MSPSRKVADVFRAGKERLLRPEVRSKSLAERARCIPRVAVHLSRSACAVVQTFPKLTAINGDFLRTKDAAEWILYRANAIDNRYPGAEDPLALQALLECYSPAEAERGYVLLRRKECSRIHGEVALDRLERTVSVGEKVPVKRCPEPCIRKVYVHLDRGIFSRIAAILLREPEYAVVLGVGEKRRIEFRMPPRAWETGIIIDPLLFDTNAIVAWYSTRSPNVLVDSVEIKVRTNRPQWLLPARARVAVVSFPM